MTAKLRTLVAGVLLIATALPLGGCETNPATGRQIITLGSTIEDDRRVGAQEHPKIVEEFGGVYDDPTVTSYVALVASKLAAASEFPNIEWRFTVLNSNELNAFALPGGYVYITRGLLALCANEAELAGVLAHEIGHVNARHSAERQGDAALAGLGAVVAGVLLGDAAGSLANTVGSGYIQHYSQSQEFEADTLGVRYLSRTGYQVGAMADFLRKMREHSRLENKVLGRPENSVDQNNFFASHPRTIDRVEQATAEAARIAGSGTVLNREAYLQHIDGLVFGDDASQGFVRGRQFVHPRLGFRFEAPEGFRLINNPSSVLAIGPNNAMIKFDMSTKPYAGSAADFMQSVWVPKAPLGNLQRIDVNGMDGATATVPMRTSAGNADGRLIAIKESNSRFYRFMIATPSDQTQRLSEGMRRMTYSLRRLSPQEAAQIRPWHIQIHQVRPGDSVASLSAGMAVGELKEDWFRVLNGLRDGAQLSPGQLVKVVRES